MAQHSPRAIPLAVYVAGAPAILRGGMARMLH